MAIDQELDLNPEPSKEPVEAVVTRKEAFVINKGAVVNERAATTTMTTAEDIKEIVNISATRPKLSTEGKSSSFALRLACRMSRLVPVSRRKFQSPGA